MSLLPLLFPLVLAPPAEAQLEVQAILDDACTICHDESDDTLNLEDVSALVGRSSSIGKALVDPGNPTGSYLYLKMVAAEGIEGESMPMGDDPLPVEQLALVRDWIAALPVAEDPASDPIDSAGDPKGPNAAGEPGDGDPKSGDPRAGDLVLPKPKSKQPFFGSHQINLQTTTTLGKRRISYRIHHRFGLVGKPGDRNYLGLAGGAVMSMGAEYGIVDGLDVMARWTTSRLDWELGLKYVPVRQEDGKPLSFGMFASFEAITDFPSSSANRLTGSFQTLISRLWFERWSTQLTVNYSLLTNHRPKVIADIDGTPTEVTDNRGTLSLGVASTLWLGKKRKNGIDIEYVLPVPSDLFFHHGGDVDPDGTKIGSWGLGWSARTGGHIFQVLVTNTRNIHTNLAAPGGDTANPFKPFGDFFFGFNITRKWKL